MSTERQFKGVWIPAEIWLDESLSVTEKVMIAEIDSLEDDVRGCFASNSHFSRFFGLSSSRISEIINSLERRGFVSIELIRDGKQVKERRIRIAKVFAKPNGGVFDIPKGGIRDSERGYSEKAEESNPLKNNPVRGKTYNAPAVAARKDSRPSSVQEVAEYMQEIGLPATEADRFMDYYTSNGWKVGKSAMKDWKATVRNWKRNYNAKPGQPSKPSYFDEQAYIYEQLTGNTASRPREPDPFGLQSTRLIEGSSRHV